MLQLTLPEMVLRSISSSTFAFLVLVGVTARETRLSDLIFPKGTTFTITVSLSPFLPQDIAKGITEVIELDLIYPVVEKVAKKPDPPKTVWVSPFPGHQLNRWEIERFRRNQMIKRRQRRDMRLQLEEAIARFGFDGVRCIRRFQCELNAVRNPETVLEDLLLILFKRPGLQCEGAEDYCPFSLLQIILHSKRVDDPVW